MRPYTRYMLKSYLWFILVVFLAILSVVTTINVAVEIKLIWNEAVQSQSQSQTQSALARVSKYVFLRILDNGSQIFTISVVLGVVWAELIHAISGRQVMVRVTGLSFFRGLNAALIIAALVLPVQLALDNLVRPYAFMTLSKKNLGEYGFEYSRIRAGRHYWWSFSNDVLQVWAKDDPHPRLLNATLYRFFPDSTLRSIWDADEIKRNPNSDRWQITEGQRWRFKAEGETEADVNSGRQILGEPIKNRNFSEPEIKISPLWLEYRDIHPKYIPTAELYQLAGLKSGLPDKHPNYRSWIHIRIAQAINASFMVICLVGLFNLLGSRLSVYLTAGVMLIFGYFGFVLTRVTAVVAEHATGASLVVTWAFPVLLLICAAILIHAIYRRDTLAEA